MLRTLTSEEMGALAKTIYHRNLNSDPRVLYFMGFLTPSGWSGVQGFLSESKILNCHSFDCLYCDELFGPVPRRGDPKGGRLVVVTMEVWPDYNAFALVPMFEKLAQMFHGEYLGSYRPGNPARHEQQVKDWEAIKRAREVTFARQLAELEAVPC